MAQGIKIAELFGEIGITFSRNAYANLDNFQTKLQKLANTVRYVQSNSRLNFGSSGNFRSLISQVQTLRTELDKIRASSNINVRTSGSVGARGARAGATGASGAERPSRDLMAGGFAGSAMSRMGLPIAAGAGTAFGLTSVYEAGTALKSIQVGLEAVTGSAEEGAKQFKFLSELSTKLGISIASNGRQYTNLLAAAQGAGISLEQAQKTFTAVASSARLLNLSQDDQEGALRAITQITSKGKVMAEELKGQLAERIPGAVALAAAAMGKSIPELFKMMEDGALDSLEFIPKLTDKIQEFVDRGDALEKAMATPAAALGRLKVQFEKFSLALLEGGLGELIIGFAESLTEALVILEPVLIVILDLLKRVTQEVKLVVDALKKLHKETSGWSTWLLVIAGALWLFRSRIAVFFTGITTQLTGLLMAGHGFSALITVVSRIFAPFLALYGVFLVLDDIVRWFLSDGEGLNTVTGNYIKIFKTQWGEFFTWLGGELIRITTLGNINPNQARLDAISGTFTPQTLNPSKGYIVMGGTTVNIDSVITNPDAGLFERILNGIAITGGGSF